MPIATTMAPTAAEAEIVIWVDTNFGIITAPRMPNDAPAIPPTRPRVDASTRNWRKIMRGVAPKAFRRPISLIRSVTETSMIFIIVVWLVIVKSASAASVIPCSASSSSVASASAAPIVDCDDASR